MKYWLIKRVSWHAIPGETESDALDNHANFQFKASAMCYGEPIELQETNPPYDYLKAAEKLDKWIPK